MGFNDWYLPSRYELVLAANNLFMYGLGNFQINGEYWTSTCIPGTLNYPNGGETWVIEFYDEYDNYIPNYPFVMEDGENADNENIVRAIRKF